MARPFLKWAGGKAQLLDSILAKKPANYSRYIEPMVGAGATFFAIREQYPDLPVVINDINVELINAYRQVRDDPDQVISELQGFVQDADTFYRIRDADRAEEFAEWTAARKAARTIYLNKLGYNGLYRVNSSGYFNVPFGKRTGVDFDTENILAASAVLQTVEIRNSDYAELLELISSDDWVYIDPPYLPITETSNFTQYNASGFSSTAHRQLRDFCDQLTIRGTKVLVSNSHSPEAIRLYSNYNISIVFARRSINSNGSRRGQVPEILISNY